MDNNDLTNRSPEVHSISLGYGSDSKSHAITSDIFSSENKSAVRLPYKSGTTSNSYQTKSSVIIEGEPIRDRRSVVKSRSSDNPIDDDERSSPSKSSDLNELLKIDKDDAKYDENNYNQIFVEEENSNKICNLEENDSEIDGRTLKGDSSSNNSERSVRFSDEMLINHEKINNKTDFAKLIKQQPNFRSLSIQHENRKNSFSKFRKLPKFLSENNLVNFFRKTHEKLFHSKSPKDVYIPNGQKTFKINASSKSTNSIPAESNSIPTFPFDSSNFSDITSGFVVRSSSNINSEANADVSHYFRVVHERLNKEYVILKSKNESLNAQYESVQAINENYKKLVLELEQSNGLLLQENKRYLQYSIKHQFLKLETTDLASKTNNFKKKLLDKEKSLNEFKQKFDELRLIKENLNKEKEIAFVEAQHNANQLSNLSHTMQELKGLKDEDIERKVFFNKLQQALGDTRVLFRVKPTNEPSCINYISTDKFMLNIVKQKKGESKEKKKLCEFSRVFQPLATNRDIYDEVMPLAELLVDGYNTCLITYGQIGSGKTHSLFGSETEPEGVAHKLLGHVLDRFKEETNWSFILALSIIEIYRGKIFDLLRSCEVEVEDDGNRIIIKDTQEILIDSYRDVINRLNQANNNRHSSTSRLNANSSKGHLLIISRVEGHNRIEKSQTSHGVMMICDTAGFDYPSGLEDSSRKISRGEADVSKSLRALGNVLLAKRDAKTIGYLYDASLLTQVLKPCLSSRTKCCLLGTSHCDRDNFQSIFQTIQFCFNAMPSNRNSDHLQPWILGD